MSTVLTWQTESSSLEDTLRLGEQIGQNLRGGEVIELVSDLGGGKTSFVRGLAIGMGSQDTVHSPSFTIGNEYKTGQLTLHHLDFYRLNDVGIMKNTINEILGDPDNVIVIEWANILGEVLPAERIQVTFKPVSDNERLIVFNYPEQLQYLLPQNT